MKWVTIISCLFLISLAESKHFYRAYRDTEHAEHVEHVVTIKRAAELSSEHLTGICVAVYSQLMQKASFEDVIKVKDDTVELAKKCTADEHSDPECIKHLHTVVLDEICHEQGIAEKYGFGACCAKTDPERHDCFMAHKNGSRSYLPPYQRPDPDVVCNHFHDNKQEVLKRYIHALGSRNPFTNPAILIHGSHEYEKVLTACCQAEDKAACFAEKAGAAKKKVKKAIVTEKHFCSLLKKFGKPEMFSLKLAALSSKFATAAIETVTKIAHDAVEAQEECCQGDTIDCLIDRDDIAKYICAHQSEVSSKVKGCCEMPPLERMHCIIHAEADDKPADLTATEFIEAAACPKFNEDKDGHIARFIHTYSRVHNEIAPVTVMKITNGYKNLLETCCGKEHPETCLAAGEEEIKKYIAASMVLVKKNCDLLKQLGSYLFQNVILATYTARVPQLSGEHLLQLTSNLVEVGNECCEKDDAHRLACAEHNMDVALGYLCYLHEEHHTNKQVCKCCGGPYPDRGECIRGLGPDPEYVDAPFNADLFTVHEDYCKLQSDIQQKTKQTMLINMIKHKHTVTDEQLAACSVDLAGVFAKCCTAENQKECFDKEIPEMINRAKATLGEA